MGFNLYCAPLSLPMPVGQFLDAPNLQLEMFNRFTAGHLPATDSDADWLAFARFYNGPGNPEAYLAAMRKAQQELAT